MAVASLEDAFEDGVDTAMESHYVERIVGETPMTKSEARSVITVLFGILVVLLIAIGAPEGV